MAKKKKKDENYVIVDTHDDSADASVQAAADQLHGVDCPCAQAFHNQGFAELTGILFQQMQGFQQVKGHSSIDAMSASITLLFTLTQKFTIMRSKMLAQFVDQATEAGYRVIPHPRSERGTFYTVMQNNKRALSGRIFANPEAAWIAVARQEPGFALHSFKVE